MPVTRIDHAVILTGSALDAVAYAVAVAQRARHRNGLPPSRMLDALAAAVTAPGHADALEDGPGDADTVTSDQAAELLGVSARTARRLAPKLGGRLIGGRWLLDRQAVAEHIEGKAHAR